MLFGDYRIEIIPDTEFGLDGGAMFGIVPRTLWSRVSPPDEANRIRMNMNCLFVDTGKQKIVIETGIGDKWSEKHAGIYAIKRERKLTESLEKIASVRAEEIDIVANTHLHFDHAGGNTSHDANGGTVATFPNARYFISQGEYEHAEQPLERDQASYLNENWRAIRASGQLELKPEQYEIAHGLTLETVPGHNRTMQCVRLEQGGRTLYNFTDIVPTRHHVPFAWLMGYDLYPVETLAAKKRLLPQAARENWLCYFYHDPDNALYSLVEEDGKLRAVEAKLSNQ